MIAVDPTESLNDLGGMIPEGSGGWVPALPSSNMLIDFNVRVQPTKILLGQKGNIVHKEGYGTFEIEELIRIMDSES